MGWVDTQDLYLAADGEISVDAIPPSHLQSAIRRVTLRRVACPVMGGSALRNRGVQPVMDAVAAFLPSPLDAPPAKAHPLQQERKGRHSAREASAKCNSGGVTPKRPTDEDLSALAFKVTCDPQRGSKSPITLLTTSPLPSPWVEVAISHVWKG